MKEFIAGTQQERNVHSAESRKSTGDSAGGDRKALRNENVNRFGNWDFGIGI